MNAATRLVFSAWKSEHIALLLRDLHWLRVPQRIEFKIAVLARFCHTLHASCADHSDDCALRQHLRLRSMCHRHAMLPSATVSSASPLSVSGTLCRPTSRHRHHCLSSKNFLIHKFSRVTLSLPIVTSVKCSISLF